MDNRLMQDMVLLLRQHISTETGIRPELEAVPLEEMAALLQSCGIARSRKPALLGCYCLMRLALTRHRELPQRDNGALTRRILDGDYLLGLYFQLAVDCNETRLVAFLAHTLKNIQIGLVHGASAEQALAELSAQLERFLRAEELRTGGDSDEAA